MTQYIFRKKRWKFLASALDAAGHLLSGFPSGFKDLPKETRAILVVRLDHIGDIVRATAIPQLIKETYPTTKLIFLTNSAGAQLIEGNPYVDETIVFDPTWYQKNHTKAVAKSHNLGQAVQLLKNRKIDVAILPRGDIRENALAKMAGIPFRVGYGITGGSFLLSRVVRYRKDAHEDEHTMDVLRAFGIDVNWLRPRLYCQGTEESAKKVFLRFGMDSDLPWVGIQMEAGTPAKEWDLKQIHGFLYECISEFQKANFYFVGQNKDVAKILDQILSDHPKLRWVNLIGKTSLGDLSVLLSKSRAFVGFDSGPTHMAAALDVPTLFVYSGTNDFEAWKPLGENATVFKNKVDCSPCHLTKCTVEGHPCLAGVSQASVIHWIKERL